MLDDDNKDLEQRKARAASLRRQISQIKGDSTQQPPPPPRPKSPRELIHDRMKELDLKKD